MKKNNFGNRSGLSIMKKILMICLVTMLTYCSNINSLSPPSWIIGEWSNSTTTLVFSSDNIVRTRNSVVLNFKTKYVNGNYSVDEESTDSSYTVTAEPDGIPLFGNVFDVMEEHKFVDSDGDLKYTPPTGDKILLEKK